MRKLTITLLSLFLGFSIFVNAQKPYTHSLGVTLGSLNGVSYKALVTDHFAISTDLGFKFNYIPVNNANLTTYTFEWNTNFMYQLNMSEHSSFFVGAGFALGYNWKLRCQVIDGYIQGWDWHFGRWGYTYPLPFTIPVGRSVDVFYNAGKAGAHGIIGFEFSDFEAPVSISIDFRPGYSTFFSKTSENKMATVGGFDWSVDFGIRYTF
ncbi:MAG: hypothetical protein MJZ72_07355 [Bacteroidales bacterium]|nr:hypothetical protein [Bacteroidales bacterium]